jgi:hypothetical protein
VDSDAEPSSMSERWPKNAPLDWFDPASFNQLPARLRASYRLNGIALPLAGHWVNDRVPNNFKTMDDAFFMEHYGNEVLALYHLPTDEEIEQMKANGEDPDAPWQEGEDDDGEDDNEGEPDEDDGEPDNGEEDNDDTDAMDQDEDGAGPSGT